DEGPSLCFRQRWAYQKTPRRTSPLFSSAAAAKDIGDGFVPFVAGILEDLIIRFAAEGNGDFPRPCIDIGIVDGDFVIDGVCIDAREAFHDVEGFTLGDTFNASGSRARRNPAFVVVVGGIDNQRIAFPVPARVAVPQFYTGRDVRFSVQGNDARIVDHFVKDDDVARNLDYAVRIVVAGRKHPAGNAPCDTSVPKAHILI